VPGNELRSPSPWEPTVTVREQPELERELRERFEKGSGRRGVGVTDLLSLRRAFYRIVGPPVPIPPARQARLDQGRAVHRALGSRLAHEGILEARVRRDGLVGRIDLLSEVPVEVKTASALVEPSDLPGLRPDHLDQLGMYCALVDRPVGRLLTLIATPEGVADVQAVDVTFRSVPRILEEMQRRAGLLRTALAEHQVDRLPRCPWFGRGCEYEDAKACSCSGEEAPIAPPLTEEVATLTPREDVRERVRSALSEPGPFAGSAPVARFREILYPRRAYFERTRPTAAPAVEAPPASREPDLYARLSEALESGPAGEVARLIGRSAEPEEEVVGFRGRPVLLRTSRAWDRFRAAELVARAPQYALELGLRCATTGTESGILVIGFERAEVDRHRIQVLELGFASLTPFSRLFRERSRALAAALREGNPEPLPACPAWMVTDCPYRSECGCGGAESRVTR
jgi:hypothetical protein